MVLDIRKFHNSVKRDLINSVAVPGQYVLDVGCGCGGDLLKWFNHDICLYGCDPDKESIAEAKKRLGSVNTNKWALFVGDIKVVPTREFDIICYNFSLQYIFESFQLFDKTMKRVHEVSKSGTKFIGIVPDSEFIMNNQKFEDSLGNSFFRKKECLGEFGEKIWVNVSGAPYYKDGPKSEPIAYKDILITRLENMGFQLEYWRSLTPMPIGYISDMYSEFCFIKQ